MGGSGIGSALHHCARFGVLLGVTEPEADGDCSIDGIHDGVIEVTHFFFQAALIQCTDLLEQDDGVFGEPDLIGIDIDMRGEACFTDTRGNGGGDDGGAMTVTDVILYDEDGSQATLLRADHRAEVSIKNISASDGVHSQIFLSFLRRGERDRIKEAGFHRQASVPILPTNRIGLNTERAVPSRNILPPYLSLQNIVED